MESSDEEEGLQQKRVDSFFDAQADYWKDTYRQKDIQGIIYQWRQAVALNYVDRLTIPKTARVLEIGCGAGYLTVALAKRGFSVEAIDHSQAMVDIAKEHVGRTETLNCLNVRLGDIHELSYKDESFDLVIALGVIPWLHNYEKALSEIARMLTSNGFAILTMDNASRATILLDPMTFPAIAQFGRVVRRKLERAGALTAQDSWKDAPPYRQHSPRDFKKSLTEAGLNVLTSTSVGFGPFTFFGRNLFSERLGIKIQQRLQQYSDKGYPIFRSTGSQYVFLVAKSKAKPILRNKKL